MVWLLVTSQWEAFSKFCNKTDQDLCRVHKFITRSCWKTIQWLLERSVWEGNFWAWQLERKVFIEHLLCAKKLLLWSHFISWWVASIISSLLMGKKYSVRRKITIRTQVCPTLKPIDFPLEHGGWALYDSSTRMCHWLCKQRRLNTLILVVLH